MAHPSGRKRGRALPRLAAAAIAAVLVGTTAGTAAADPAPAVPAPAADAQKRIADAPQPLAAPRSTFGPTADAPVFPLLASKRDGSLYVYDVDGRGGFADRRSVSDDWSGITATAQVDHDQDGTADGWYIRASNGDLFLTSDLGDKEIGGGWNIYDRIFSPGNLGGAGEADLLARDKNGVLWLYLAYPDGTLTGRYQVGGGWEQYTDIAGRGDYNGDGKTDIVAKDRNGDLWFYKGTGNYKRPFETRVKVGGGWNAYNKLVSSGDVDRDGRSDLLARDKNGVLWLYKSNGGSRDPFDSRVKIGGGWDQYNDLF
ncbi:VCBS repeat-containing protein [Streptomyces sp. ET3-23]|uniref:FG-GAP repeat domain-containing protein n=1 Tax=Streptomyces sp. ET3-23 TaxID=2885643 RepID=UPI001D12D6DD|nr:VCBS repeat-containing protein [Streptomyces sp. ET3-23]MCC2276705.1 VCBS repeat-containing protein [Streptomyces sp. ET3-23]